MYHGEGMAACVDILVMMSYHPLFYQFMTLEADDDMAVIGEKKKQRDFSTVKRKVAGSSYKSHAEFASDVRLTFATPLTYELPTTVSHQAAAHLLVFFERLYARWVLGVKGWKSIEVDVYQGIDTSMWKRKKRNINATLPSLASSTDFMLHGISMDGLGLGFPLGWMGRVSERSYASNHIDRFFMSPDGRVYRSFVSISYDHPEIIVDRDKFKVWEKQVRASKVQAE